MYLSILTFDDGVFRWTCYAPDNNRRIEATACNHSRIRRPRHGIHPRVMETPFPIMRKLQNYISFEQYFSTLRLIVAKYIDKFEAKALLTL